MMKVDACRALIIVLAIIGGCFVALTIYCSPYSKKNTTIDQLSIPQISTNTVSQCSTQEIHSPDLLPIWCSVNSTKTIDSVEKEKRFPEAIIIGVRKAGTGTLLRMLLAHPLIKGPSREMNFWDDENSDTAEGGTLGYLNHMPPTSQNEITIEKSPSYVFSDLAMKRLYYHSPKLKILMIVRDPTIRSISGYVWRMQKHRWNELNRTFESYIFDNDEKTIPDAQEIYESLYDVHYEKWADKFGAEQI